MLIIDLNTAWGIQGFDITQTSVAGFRRGIADISWDGTWNFIAVVSRDGDLYIVNLLTEEVATVLDIDGQLNAVYWNPRTNQVTYAGVSSTGEPMLETVDGGGIAGVPMITPTMKFTPTATFTPTPSATPTSTFTSSPTATPTFTETSTPTLINHPAHYDCRQCAPQFRLLNVTASGSLTLEDMTRRNGSANRRGLYGPDLD